MSDVEEALKFIPDLLKSSRTPVCGERYKTKARFSGTGNCTSGKTKSHTGAFTAGSWGANAPPFLF